MYKTLFLLFTLCLLPLMSCPAHGSYVYVTNYGDGTVSQFRANPNGTLTPLSPPSVKAWPRCHSLVVSSSGRYLYVLSALEFSRRNCLVSQYRINADGRLTPLMPLHVILPSGATPYLLFSEPTGRFLYVLERGGMIYCLHIGTTGALKLADLPAQDVGLRGSFGYSVAFDQTHSVFYASGETRMTNMWLGWLTAFRAAKNGALHSMGPLFPKTHSDPSYYLLQIVTAHQGCWAYLLYDWTSSAPGPALMQYTTHPEGGLATFALSTIQLDYDPQEMVADPQGHFLYLLGSPKQNRDSPAAARKIILAHYRIGRGGILGQSSQQTFPAPRGLFSPIFGPSGRYLYLLAENSVLPFRVHADGAVTDVGIKSTSAGHGPHRVTCVQR